MEEFKDFNKYLVYMESQGAHRAGLAKVGGISASLSLSFMFNKCSFPFVKFENHDGASKFSLLWVYCIMTVSKADIILD